MGSIKIAFLFAPGWLDSAIHEEVEGAGVWFAGDEQVNPWGVASLGDGWTASLAGKRALKTGVVVASFSAVISFSLRRLLFFLLYALWASVMPPA